MYISSLLYRLKYLVSSVYNINKYMCKILDKFVIKLYEFYL